MTGKLQTSNVFLCHKCLVVHTRRAAYETHKQYCSKDMYSRFRLPENDFRAFFDERGVGDVRLFKSALMIFFDFESLQEEPEAACSCSKEKLAATARALDPILAAERILENLLLFGEAVEAYETVQDFLISTERGDKRGTAVPNYEKHFAPLEKSLPRPRFFYYEESACQDAQDLGEYCMQKMKWEQEEEDKMEEEMVEEVLLEAEGAEKYEEVAAAAVTLSELEAERKKASGGKRTAGSSRNFTSFLPVKEKKVAICKHRTKIISEQPPFCYSLILVDRNGRIREKKNFVGYGEEVTDNFVMTVLNLADKYLPDLLSPGTAMNKLSLEEEVAAATARFCYICSHPMGEGDRVRDHDHLTGKFLGVAHKLCNLHRREVYTLTCFAHNFSGYDSHFLVRSFNRFPERIRRINAIPLTTEKFKCLTINDRIRFLDSFAFQNDALEKLVDTLDKSGGDFPVLEQLVTGENKELLTCKGVYPYSFATSVEKLRKTRKLPSREEFFNDLRQEECSKEDYEHAQKVWETFNCENMLDYSVLYCCCDVALLADVMLNFRDMIWDNFELDACQYLSLPHLAMDVMLKETGAQIEHIKDLDMALQLKSAIRGGLSFVNLRYAERGEKQCIMYLDANALYAHAMSQALPLRGYCYMTEEEIAAFDVEKHVSPAGRFGFILTVDLEYPEELHLSHNGYPMAAESRDIKWDELSDYSKLCLQEIYGKMRHKARKLTATFYMRERYTVHALNLKLYLRHGLKLKKIHDGIKFEQSAFLAPFIAKCTRKRQYAVTKSLSNMWKVVANACFGKFIESTDRRMDCRFSRSAEEARKHTSNPLYKARLICGEDLTISFLEKTSIEMSQSWAIGFSILEISKYIMLRLYYDRLRPLLGSKNVALMMSDTDSFLIRVKGKGEEETLRLLSPFMDFSNLAKEHPLYDNSRPKHPGYLKTEIPMASIAAAAALKAKTYALKVDRHVGERKKGDDRLNRAKGVTSAVKDRIRFEEYKACVFDISGHEVEQRNIRSYAHRNKLVLGQKMAFSSFDDKRFQLCRLHSCPYGSWVIRWQQSNEGKCYFCINPDEYN